MEPTKKIRIEYHPTILSTVAKVREYDAILVRETGAEVVVKIHDTGREIRISKRTRAEIGFASGDKRFTSHYRLPAPAK